MSTEKHFFGKVATKAIIAKGDTVLMVRDNHDSDTWDLPGGRINEGESIAEAVQREIQEELGVEVEFESFVYSEQLIHTFDGNPHLFITCKVNLKDPEQAFNVPSDELAEIIWIDANALDQLKVYGNCARAIQAFWNNKK